MTDLFDMRLREAWRDAGDAVTPVMTGRLRAARREALSEPPAGLRAASRLHGPLQWIGVPAAAVAVVVAVALLVPRGDDTPMIPIASTQQPDNQSPAPAGIEPLDVLTLEDDPDFYLWLARNAAAVGTREVSDEPI